MVSDRSWLLIARPRSGVLEHPIEGHTAFRWPIPERQVPVHPSHRPEKRRRIGDLDLPVLVAYLRMLKIWGQAKRGTGNSLRVAQVHPERV